jgi:AraC-like DNA-binding protein
MTATKVTSDKFKVSSLLTRRLGEHKLSAPDVLRRAGLPAGFFQQEKIYATTAELFALWRATRRELAHHYLRHSTAELNETAFLLGYGDANSFFRAFHGWEGTSPGEWRTRHRTAHAEAPAH